MPDELKDVTQPDSPATEPAKVAATDAPPALTDRDASELGQLLLDQGITKDQLNDLMAAPQALAALRYQIENDPAEFIKSVERANPGAGENFLDKLSKLYVDRYSRDDTQPSADGKKGESKAVEQLQDKLREMSERLEGYATAQERAAAASAQAQVQARYNARVDDLFGQLPADKFPLSDFDKGLIRKALSSDIANDPNAVKRVYNGNFVDVPRQFKTIVEGLASDRKAAADAEKSKRERAANAPLFPELGNGPVDVPKDFYDVSNVPTDKLWDEDTLVKMLERGA